MRKTILLTIAVLSAIPSALWAKDPNVLDIKTSITDDAIIFPESFEADTQKILEGWYMRNYTATDTEDKKDPQTSDETIRKRLAALPTVIEMPFNSIVRQYIDRYTQRSRAQVSAILGLSFYYMPIFEQALEERGLPQELKYLPVIESGLDPNAVSSHGATGLWQFMLATGKGLGLECNSLVDERRDPYASSAAAADYLKSLFDTYGDWSLAIAAYNCGPSAVNKAIRRAGDPEKPDFWAIYDFLTPETRGYVPMFIAANYVMNHYTDHNISPVLPTKPLVTDTIGITDRVHFNQISTILGIPLDELRILNPQYREDLVPGTPERPYMLALPQQQIHAYIMSHDQILAYEAEKYRRRDFVEPGLPGVSPDDVEAEEEDAPAAAAETVAYAENPGPEGEKVTVTHTVAAGETLNSIAEKYGVQATEIRSANNLRRNAVRVGQSLTINNVAADKAQLAAASAKDVAKESQQTARTEEKKAETAAPAAKTQTSKQTQKAKAKNQTAKAEAAKPTTHSIKSGESLSSISKKYGVTVEELKRANNMKDDNIRAGKTLTIPAKASKSAGSSKSKKKKRR